MSYCHESYTMLVLTFLISASYMLPASVQTYKICFRLWLEYGSILYGFNLYSKW